MIGASYKDWITPPTIPFQYPSGTLNVQVTYPDGSESTLGSAPFLQPYIQEVSGPNGQRFSGASITADKYFSLTTLDSRFDINFTQYGRHLVTMQGSIDDIWGTTYQGGGTYEVHVARLLDLEAGVMPNTPFEVGDVFSPTVIVQPGVAADVQIIIKHYPQSDPDL